MSQDARRRARRFQGHRQRSRGFAKGTQFSVALVTSDEEMLGQSVCLFALQSIEGGKCKHIFDFLVLHRRLDAYYRLPERALRSLIMALRIRVFAVPTGIPSLSAIWLCDSSEKYASSSAVRS